MQDSLSTSGIKKYLNKQTKDMNIEIYPVLPSTNLTLKEKAAAGAPEGTVIIAEEQTMGRGRLGRSFFSPANTGIYMSILLKPELSPSDSTLITTAAAVAVSEAIEEITGENTVIKWINDIWIKRASGKDYAKVCGILTEAAVSANNKYPDYIILGIGINVFEPENGFPKELTSIATSAVNMLSATNGSDIRNRIIAATLNKFMEFYPDLTKRTFLDEYRKRSVVLGKKINIIENTLHPDISFVATAINIDDDCNLIVELEDGTRKSLYSGEISIRL